MFLLAVLQMRRDLHVPVKGLSPVQSKCFCLWVQFFNWKHAAESAFNSAEELRVSNSSPTLLLGNKHWKHSSETSSSWSQLQQWSPNQTDSDRTTTPRASGTSLLKKLLWTFSVYFLTHVLFSVLQNLDPWFCQRWRPALFFPRASSDFFFCLFV